MKPGWRGRTITLPISELNGSLCWLTYWMSAARTTAQKPASPYLGRKLGVLQRPVPADRGVLAEPGEGLVALLERLMPEGLRRDVLVCCQRVLGGEHIRRH